MTAVPVVPATLTTRTVREWKPLGADGWEPAPTDDEEALSVTAWFRQRLTVDPVFVVVDAAPDLTCRDCLGIGWMRASKFVRSGSDDPTCPSCNGTGVSPVYAATWQHRHIVGVSQTTFDGYEWGIWHRCNKVKPEPRAERRQVVEWRATDVTVLPVLASGHPDEDSTPSYEVDRHGAVFDPLGWVVADDNGCLEPWAVDLRPGQFVVRLSGWEHLDTPHTEQFCGCAGDPDNLDPDANCPRCDGFATVPLSVPDGAVTWIEPA